jgi:hypothetical protein
MNKRRNKADVEGFFFNISTQFIFIKVIIFKKKEGKGKKKSV